LCTSLPIYHNNFQKINRVLPKFLEDHRRYFAKTFYLHSSNQEYLGETNLSLKLKVDGKEIPLNEFVGRMLSGTITGGVSSLKGIKEDWEKIEIEIQK